MNFNINILIFLGCFSLIGMATGTQITDNCVAEVIEGINVERAADKKKGPDNYVFKPSNPTKRLLHCIIMKSGVIEKNHIQNEKLQDILKELFDIDAVDSGEAIHMCTLLYHPKDIDSVHYIIHCLVGVLDLYISE